MGLESATFISQLDNSFPLGGDPINQGDDHMRLVKSVLQNQFPNLTALAVNPSSVELNLLVGLLATAAELNILDGALVTTAELNALQSFVGTINRALVSDGSGNIVVSPVTVAELNKLDGLLASTAELNLVNGLLASTSELNVLNGILSSTAELNRLQSYVGTASRALVSNGSGNIVVSGVTTTELNKLDGLLASTSELNKLDGATLSTAELNFSVGVTSLIQTQLGLKAPLASPSFTGIANFDGQVRFTKGSDVASAAALNLGSDGNMFDITGATGPITSINTEGVGSLVILHFDSNPILTHHATNLVLPGAGNIQTSAGDMAVFYEYTTGGWRCISYQSATSAPIALQSGNWTPTLIASGTDPTQSYNTQNGKYRVFNDQVWLAGFIAMAFSGITSGTGQARIGGLPFTTTSQQCGGSIGNAAAWGLSVGAPSHMESGGAYLRLYTYDNDAGNLVNFIHTDAADIDAFTTVSFSIMYLT